MFTTIDISLALKSISTYFHCKEKMSSTTTSDVTISNMPYVRLGKSGLKVSKLILGCMSYGTPEWQGWVLEEEEALKHIKAAYDLGINAFDTANVYSNGRSEIILGKAIKQFNLPRDEIVIMTKVYFPVARGTRDDLFFATPEEVEKRRYVNQQGLSRKHIFESIKHSLERLQLDYVDLLQCEHIFPFDFWSLCLTRSNLTGHRFDYNTPIEETMQALHDVVKAGYARYTGMSSCYAWQFHKMQSYARQHGLTEFISMQNYYNAAYREEEREMVPLLQDMGVGMIPWSPLARGFLTRTLEEGSSREAKDNFFKGVMGDSEGDTFLMDINKKVSEIAKKRGISMAQVAVAWSMSKPFITAPIVGTTSLDKLEDLVGAVNVKLTEDEVKAIDDLYRPRAIIGHS